MEAVGRELAQETTIEAVSRTESNPEPDDSARHLGRLPRGSTMRSLADALDTIGCEGAADLIDGDWRPLHQGNNVNIC